MLTMLMEDYGGNKFSKYLTVYVTLKCFPNSMKNILNWRMVSIFKIDTNKSRLKMIAIWLVDNKTNLSLGYLIMDIFLKSHFWFLIKSKNLNVKQE